MLKIAITGGMGSGKSEVCRYLSLSGIPVYDCDSAVKRLYKTDASLVAFIAELFGAENVLAVEKEQQQLDLKKLASVIFSEPEKLISLEKIVHPALLKDYAQWCDKQEEAGETLTVLESALILEKPLFEGLFDKIIVVDAPYDERLERACTRDSLTREEAEKRMQRQHLYNEISRTGEFPDCVDFIIMNNSDRKSLYIETDDIFQIIYDEI